MASRRSVVTLMSTISLLVFPLNTRAADAPMAMIQTATQKTLAVLQNPAYQGAAHCGERLAQVAATILPHFDTEGMSQRALELYWRQLTTDQQQEFVRLFTALVEHAYGGAIDRHARDVQVTIFRLLKTRGAAGAKELLGEVGGDYRHRLLRGLSLDCSMPAPTLLGASAARIWVVLSKEYWCTNANSYHRIITAFMRHLFGNA